MRPASLEFVPRKQIFLILGSLKSVDITIEYRIDE